jgi:iron complex transport system permease protein
VNALTVLRPGRVSLRVDRRAVTVCLALLGVATMVAAVSLATGDYPISVPDAVRALAGGGDPADRFIVTGLRLPRALTALLVGAALGASGAIFQSVARNPLASPDLIGFTSGAATGAVVTLLVIADAAAGLATGALVGGLLAALGVYSLAWKRGLQGYRLVLVGVGVTAVLESVNWYLLSAARLLDAQAAQIWLFGTLNGRSWEHVRTVGVALVVLVPLAAALGRSLRMLELGDEQATGLGVPIERTRVAAVVVGTALAAAAIAVAGPIAFVALAAPQLARRLTRAAGPNIVPAAAMGALLLVAADLIAQRALAPTQLPVGIATATLGGAYLAWLLSREWRSGRA